MKFIITTALCCLVLSGIRAQSYSVSLNAPQFEKGISYLVYYYGQNMNVVDSVAVGADGKALFQSEKTLSPGVYAVVLPGKRISYDFLVGGEQHISILIKDTANTIGSAVVSGSKENIIFKDYQRFVAQKGAALERERQAFMQSKTKADSSLHERAYVMLNRELNSYRDSIISHYPESMLTSLLKSMKEPKVLHPQPKNAKDSAENYQYYKQHYWDGVTFTDDRIIRTPFFIPKIERYFRQVLDQRADSIIKEADYLILLSRTNEPMYQFLINWLTDEYYQPKVMGQDKVFVHLFEKYHSKGLSSWLNEKQLNSITERAYMVMSNLIGEPAAPLIMTGMNGKVKGLYDVAARFTIVSFWDPTCGHCRTEMPVLDSMYRAKWKKEGVKIFAVLTDNAVKDKWEQFVNDNHLGEWVHVYESDAQEQAIHAANKPSYRQLYDVIQTPTVYLLDSEKRIIAKKLTLAQIDDLIDMKLNAAKN